MEPHGPGNRVVPRTLGKAACQHIHAVKLGMAGNTVDFVHQLGNFHLNVETIFLGINTVGSLDGKFPHPLNDVLAFLEVSFADLDKGNAVGSVV